MMKLWPNLIHKPSTDGKSVIREAVVDCSPVSEYWIDMRAHIDRQRKTGHDGTGRSGGVYLESRPNSIERTISSQPQRTGSV